MQIKNPLVTVVMPCLNEEKTIGLCIEKIKNCFAQESIDGEIIVSDNGSTDRSVEIAQKMGARVIHQPLRGYGNAYLKGFESANGKFLIMGDSDNTYDFDLIPKFLSKLEEGEYDFVTGSRYRNGFKDKSMPFLHRYIGNPLLTFILNFFFGTRFSDVYCGFRAFTRKAYELIKPVSPGMEFNLELAINAGLAKLKVEEIPIRLAPREGQSKLRTFKDGWRSLRMMLLYCPNKVYLWPGFLLFIGGILLHVLTLFKLIRYEGRPLSGMTGIFASIFSVVGFQILGLGLYAKTYSWSRRFQKESQILKKFYNLFKLETGLALGGVTMVIGILIDIYLFIFWLKSNLAPLTNPEWVSFGATLIIIGFSIIFNSLFISAMRMSEKLREYDA